MILLDTHVLIWLVAGSRRVGPRARRAIQIAWDQGAAHASCFTFWEIALLHTAGRVELDIHPRALSSRLQNDGLQVIPVDDEIAIRSVRPAEWWGSAFQQEAAAVLGLGLAVGLRVNARYAESVVKVLPGSVVLGWGEEVCGREGRIMSRLEVTTV